MVWVGKDLIDHLIPTPLPWADESRLKVGLTFIIINLIFKLLYDDLFLFFNPDIIVIPQNTVMCKFWVLWGFLFF